ncbi:MAG: hypothetical protein R3B13_05705 [Polyangiaceae bacterium]
MPTRDSRATVATVVATAAVTIAIGVTAAGLGGYIVPAADQGSPTSTENATQPTNQSTAPSAATNVVLVPVTPDVPVPDPAAGGQPEFVFANEEHEAEEHEAEEHEAKEHEAKEHEGRRKGHHERHEGEHDDD